MTCIKKHNAPSKRAPRDLKQYLKNLFKSIHVMIVPRSIFIVLEDKKKSFEEQLTQDVIELMTVFCAKLYGKRSHNNKRKVIV